TPGKRERKAGEAEQEKAGDDGALRPEPRGGDAARNPAQQGPGAESTHQNSGADLGQAEVLGIARDERRQRGEEHRVDEDDRADEDEQSAHAVEDMQRLDRRSATTSRLQKKCTEPVGAFVRLSDGPPPKRLPIGEPSTSDAPYSVHA